MKCRCGGELHALETRDGPLNTIRRRRQCSTCGQRVTTHEAIGEPDVDVLRRHRKTRRESARRQWAKLSPDERRARTKRKKLRMAARREARETGEPVDQIYARWGCA
ncbi:hypothetical protein [Ancylobacter polymorphus]|uniref:NrdR family transcriptional regulator n=1 Tax=Ancylobacter polymorphus TaxID=223390 RepID=UPI003521650A